MNNYRKARTDAKLKPEKVAAELEVSISTLFSWERGDTSPTGPQIKKLAQLYKRSADYLLAL